MIIQTDVWLEATSWLVLLSRTTELGIYLDKIKPEKNYWYREFLTES